MNYYIQGDEAKAEQIKAAFDKLGFDPAGWNCDGIHSVYFTVPDDNKVRIVHISIGKIIMTHPDYKELELPVQHKFKVGDWLVYNNGNCFAGGFSVAQVVKVIDGVYFFASSTSGSYKFIDENCRLWTIEDAKDGDVLTSINFHSNCTFIFNGLDNWKFDEPNGDRAVATGYCCLSASADKMEFGIQGPDCVEINTIKPATKIQRDMLFAKMREAGYEWDEKKKELRKIKPHYDISNFHAGMPVLVRDAKGEEWRYTEFSHLSSRFGDNKFCAGGTYWVQCIPFSEDTKHLLGTTDMCDEKFINW